MWFASLARRLSLRGHRVPLLPHRQARRAPRLEVLEDRLALNNRFVVPLELPADNATTFHLLSTALTTPGLAPGNIVQIEPGSTPGAISDSILPDVTNLTIRGHPGFAARDLPEVTTTSDLVVDAAREGLRLENLRLTLIDTRLVINANARLVSCHIVCAGVGGPSLTDVIALTGTTAASLRNNTIINYTNSGMIQVSPGDGAHNDISGNTFIAGPTHRVLEFSGSNPSSDLIRENTFIGGPGSGGAMVVIRDGVNGAYFYSNTFRDADGIADAILVFNNTQQIQFFDNAFDFPGAADTDSAVRIGVGTATMPTSVILARNQFRGGIGIRVDAPSNFAMSVVIEGNNFLKNSIGVRIDSLGTSTKFVDLGGGELGSKGANDFRSFKTTATATSGAIVVAAPVATGPIPARFNLFGTANPETSILDGSDFVARADAVTTGAVAGHAAFVQALYLRFLRRVGDVSNPAGAGFWVSRLNAGVSPFAVANTIARSTEALGLVVDDLFRRILGRSTDAAGRTFWVSFLATGGTLEQAQAAFFSSTEYRLKFAGDAAYIASLYQVILGRTPTLSDINLWRGMLPALGRSGMAAAFLASAEHRGRFVTRLYTDLVKRPAPPSAAEVAVHVNGGLDQLSLTVAFAGSPEFQATG